MQLTVKIAKMRFTEYNYIWSRKESKETSELKNHHNFEQADALQKAVTHLETMQCATQLTKLKKCSW